MPFLNEVAADADVLLALEPEELAGRLLRVAASAQRENHGRGFHPGNISALFDDSEAQPPGMRRWPRRQEREIMDAFGEAWQWLRVNLLVIPQDESNGVHGWLRISRRGARLLDESKFLEFREAALFPKTLLHPSIADQVWLSLARGELDVAVFVAFRQVEVVVRDVSGIDDLGVRLMRSAFGERGPLRSASADIGERDALQALFAGAIGSYKNPVSHRTGAVRDPREAQEMVVLASHLLRIVDDTRTRLAEAQT